VKSALKSARAGLLPAALVIRPGMPPLVALVSRRARDRVICWIINSNGRTGWVNRMMLAQGG